MICLCMCVHACLGMVRRPWATTAQAPHARQPPRPTAHARARFPRRSADTCHTLPTTVSSPLSAWLGPSSDSSSMVLVHAGVPLRASDLDAAAAAAHKRREARRRDKGSGSGYQPVSCAQRVLWAFAGSGMTAVLILVYLYCVAPFSQSWLVRSI